MPSDWMAPHKLGSGRGGILRPPVCVVHVVDLGVVEMGDSGDDHGTAVGAVILPDGGVLGVARFPWPRAAFAFFVDWRCDIEPHPEVDFGGVFRCEVLPPDGLRVAHAGKCIGGNAGRRSIHR